MKMKKKFLIGILVFVIIMTCNCVYAMDTFLLRINTQGLGQIAITQEGKMPEFNSEYPMQTTSEKAVEGTKLVVGAKAGDGCKFVKWTNDGIEYSNDEIITIEMKKDMNLIAVFEFEGVERQENETDNNTDDLVKENENNEEVSNFNITIIFIIVGIVIVLGLSIISIKTKRKKNKKHSFDKRKD